MNNPESKLNKLRALPLEERFSNYESLGRRVHIYNKKKNRFGLEELQRGRKQKEFYFTHIFQEHIKSWELQNCLPESVIPYLIDDIIQRYISKD